MIASAVPRCRRRRSSLAAHHAGEGVASAWTVTSAAPTAGGPVARAADCRAWTEAVITTVRLTSV